jgi:hypothetical protein
MKGESMPSEATLQPRLRKTVESLKKTEMDAILLNRVGNIAYLTGVLNSYSWVFITRKGDHLALVLKSDAAM